VAESLITKERLILVVIASMPLMVIAENLRDPTLPPAQFLNNTPQERQAESLELQSVVIGTHHKAAMINGQMVQVGQKYQDKLLFKVTEQAAFLSASDGSKQVLRMEFPVERKLSTDTKAEKARKYARPSRAGEKLPTNAKG
jgi:hypothetical protein